MKIYTQTYDLTKASPQRFWVTPFSDFKIGIKLLSKGELANKDFTLKAGAIELTPDEDKIDGFTIFTIKSGNTGFVDYTIEVAGIAEKLKLTQIVTDSTVFDVGVAGGNGRGHGGGGGGGNSYVWHYSGSSGGGSELKAMTKGGNGASGAVAIRFHF